MTTIQENKETIIRSFSSVKTGLKTLENNVTENYIDKPTFAPIAKAAYQEYPLWKPETSYNLGDMICIKNRQGTILNARCIKDFVSAKDASNNEIGWEADVQLGNIQITPILNSTVGGPAWALMKGFTLDAWEIENLLNNAEVKIGDLKNLQTTKKDNLVNAVNEIKNSAGSNGSSLPEGLYAQDGLNSNTSFVIGDRLPTTATSTQSSLLIGKGLGYMSNLDECLIIGNQENFQDFDENAKNMVVIGENAAADRKFNDEELRLKISNGEYQDSFKVSKLGNVWCQGSVSSEGADYAEMFEWIDGDYNEDRKQMFVSLNKDKIQIAKSENEYVIGIISTKPSIIGNNIGERNSKEWGIVGLLGQLEVKDNGKCIPGEMCSVENGIAVPGNKYYVMERLDSNLIKVLFK